MWLGNHKERVEAESWMRTAYDIVLAAELKEGKTHVYGDFINMQSNILSIWISPFYCGRTVCATRNQLWIKRIVCRNSSTWGKANFRYMSAVLIKKKKSRLDNNKTEVYFNFFLVEIA